MAQYDRGEATSGMDDTSRLFLPNRSTLPIGPTQEEKAQQLKYQKYLKIRAAVFPTVTICLLILGLFFICYFFHTNRSVLAFGVILTTVGFMCLIISLVMLPTFIRVMYIHSNTVYMPKSAEALQHIPYPRQPVRRKSFAPRPPSLLQSRASTGPPAQAPFSYTHPLEPTAPYPPTEFHPTIPKLPPSYAEVAASYA
uniref:Uncharacterized protein n=2 Tax=Schistocephalus solidus TaxID=70667 RepID=A0A0X3Q7Y7_SCHSO